jgi:hypothetical protein
LEKRPRLVWLSLVDCAYQHKLPVRHSSPKKPTFRIVEKVLEEPMLVTYVPSQQWHHEDDTLRERGFVSETRTRGASAVFGMILAIAEMTWRVFFLCPPSPTSATVAARVRATKRRQVAVCLFSIVLNRDSFEVRFADQTISHLNCSTPVMPTSWSCEPSRGASP